MNATKLFANGFANGFVHLGFVYHGFVHRYHARHWHLVRICSSMQDGVMFQHHGRTHASGNVHRYNRVATGFRHLALGLFLGGSDVHRCHEVVTDSRH